MKAFFSYTQLENNSFWKFLEFLEFSDFLGFLRFFGVCWNFWNFGIFGIFGIFRKHRKKSMFCKTLDGRLPPRMAPFGLNLRENAFQMIPDISFFDVGKKIGKKNDKNFPRKKCRWKMFKLPVLDEL